MASPPPGVDPNQWGQGYVADLRRRGQNPVAFGFGGTQQEQADYARFSQSQQSFQPQSNPAAPPQSSGPTAPQQQSGGAYSASSPGRARSQQSPYASATSYNPSARIRDNRMPQPGEVTRPRQPGPMQYDPQSMMASLSQAWQSMNANTPTGSRMPGQPAFAPVFQQAGAMPNAGAPAFQSVMTGPFGQPANPGTYYPQQQAMLGNIFNQMAQAPSGTWLGNTPPPPAFTAPPAFNPMAMWQQAGLQVAAYSPFAR